MTKKEALQISNLISQLQCASAAVDRRLAETPYNVEKTEWWMSYYDEAVLELRELLKGTFDARTFKETNEELSNNV